MMYALLLSLSMLGTVEVEWNTITFVPTACGYTAPVPDEYGITPSIITVPAVACVDRRVQHFSKTFERGDQAYLFIKNAPKVDTSTYWGSLGLSGVEFTNVALKQN